jgi:hypothetical protein
LRSSWRCCQASLQQEDSAAVAPPPPPSLLQLLLLLLSPAPMLHVANGLSGAAVAAGLP